MRRKGRARRHEPGAVRWLDARTALLSGWWQRASLNGASCAYRVERIAGRWTVTATVGACIVS